MRPNIAYLLALSTAAVSILPESTSSESTSFVAVEHEHRHLVQPQNNVVREEEEPLQQVRGEKGSLPGESLFPFAYFKKDFSEVPVGEGTNGTCGVARAPTPEWAALIDTIGWADGPDGRYDVLFGRGRFFDYRGHPVETGEMSPEGVCQGSLCSTAAGRPQVNHSTYEGAVERGYFRNGFWPKEQDRATIHFAERRDVTQALLEQAVEHEDLSWVRHLLRNRWTGLMRRTPQEVTDVYLQCWEVQRRIHRRR